MVAYCPRVLLSSIRWRLDIPYPALCTSPRGYRSIFDLLSYCIRSSKLCLDCYVAWGLVRALVVRCYTYTNEM